MYCTLICILFLINMFGNVSPGRGTLKITEKNISNVKMFSEINKVSNNISTVEREKYDEIAHNINLNDVEAFGYPNDETPISVYGTQLFGREWDSDRQMWRYRWRFDWYQAKRGEAFGDQGWDEDPYVVLQVDLIIDERGIVQGSGNAFGYGGWNVHEHNTGDFEDVATVVCNAVIGLFPTWYSLTFGTGVALARALRDAPPDPQYTWMGKQIWEASGFYQYDCYIYPDTDWEIKFRLDFWGSSIDRGYQDYAMIWRWYGHSPGPGPAKLELLPSYYNFGEVKVGESKTKTFILKNVGGEDAYVNDVYISGSSDFNDYGFQGGWILSGKEQEIKVTFRPTSSGSKNAVLKVDAENCEDVSSSLSGKGKKKNSIKGINPVNILEIFVKDLYHLEKTLNCNKLNLTCLYL